MNSVLNSDLVQAIRGPILLITLGSLVALDNLAGVSFVNRTWPVLLIVFGLLKLMEKSAARPALPPRPPYPEYPGYHLPTHQAPTYQQPGYQDPFAPPPPGAGREGRPQ